MEHTDDTAPSTSTSGLTRLQRIDLLAARWAERMTVSLLIVLMLSLTLWYLFFQRQLEITTVHVRRWSGDHGPEFTLQFNAKNSHLQAVQMTLVRGEAPWFGTSRTLVPLERGDARVVVATGIETASVAAPQRATFEFRLIDADGTRSGPFMYTLGIPSPAPRP